MNSSPRFICAAVLIAAAAIFLQARSRGEVFPPRQPLQSFPQQLGGWTSAEDIPIEQNILDVLRPTDYVERVYQNQQAGQPRVGLFIAYYRSQRAGEAPHSPQHCLPGAGLVPLENTHVTISVSGHDPFPANRYVVAQGDSRSLVLYWFWAHDRGVASEYWAKYYLITDSIKMNRSDGSLVRLITPILPGESSDGAEQRIMPFTAQVVPQLNNYIPR